MTAYLLNAPSIEPVSLAEAKAHLRVEGTDQDSLITSLITAARLHVEQVTHRALIDQDWRLVLDRIPHDGCVELVKGPLRAINAMTLFDDEGTGTLLPMAEIVLDIASVPGRLVVPDTLYGHVPVRAHLGIEIDYKVGYGASAQDVPLDLKQAILSLVAHWFDHRDAVIATGGGAIMPVGFEALIQPYEVMGL